MSACHQSKGGSKMSGQPGRSGGHNKKSLRELKLTGQFRPSRHRHLVDQPAFPPPLVYDWQPTDVELARLGPEGRSFIASALRRHEHTFMAGAVLLMAAAVIDHAAVLRKDVDDRGIMLTAKKGTRTINPSVKAQLQAARWLSSLRNQLRIVG